MKEFPRSGPLLWLCVLIVTKVCGGLLQAQECAYLPPAGPMAFGLLEVGRFQRTVPVGDSPVWMDDGRVVVGASESSVGGYRFGAVYVFPAYHSTLSEPQSIITPQDPEIGSFGAFGVRLATSGSWLAVSARRTNDQHIICMLQATNATGFAFRTNLVAEGMAGERLGDALHGFAMHGEWLAALRYGNNRSGIFMYHVTDDGVWEMKQELSWAAYPDTMPNSAKVDIYGRTLLVTYDAASRADVWRLGDDGVWAYETQLMPQGVTGDSGVGAGLDVAEDRIFLGAPEFEKTATSGGGVFIFKRANGQWVEESRILASALSSPRFIGSEVAYSDLAGEWLATSSSYFLTMFQPNENGVGWKRVSQGRQGRFFDDWESPGGNFEDYGYDRYTTPVSFMSARSYQVLLGFKAYAVVMEHGLHAVRLLRVTSDPPCKMRPIGYGPIGAPKDDTENKIGDLDSDGVGDIAEIYFGTFTDVTNNLSSGLKPFVGAGGETKVQWPRLKEPSLLVKGKPEWSSDLVNWTSVGIVETKIGEDAAGREIIETTLPSGGATAFMRLALTAEVPESQ